MTVPARSVGAAAREELHLDLMGDWGTANLYAACGWIASGLRRRSAPSSTFVVHTSASMDECGRSVIEGKVDLAFITPLALAGMLVRGIGLYDRPRPELRALATLPHRDRLVLAVARDVAERQGIATYDDLAARRPPLRIAIGPEGEDHAFAAAEILRCYGMRSGDLERWGGEWVRVERPPELPAIVASRRADGLFTERVMRLHELCEARPLLFFGLDDDVLTDLRSRFGWERATIDPGDLPGIEIGVPTIDWGGWVALVRSDMSDATAAAIVRVMVEDHAIFEAKYTHLPVMRSPLHYPITPEKLVETGAVPLHDGAAAYFASIGVTSAAGIRERWSS